MSITRRTFVSSAVFGVLSLTLGGCSSPEATRSLKVPPATDTLRCTFFKVGKADAMLLTTKDACVMVDTGDAGSADDVVASLEELGIKTIDTLIVTHYDQDHIGGAAEVIDNFDVKQVLVTYRSKESLEIEAYDASMAEKGLSEQTLTADTTIQAGQMTIDILTPRLDEYDEDTSNNSSLVCRVTFGKTRLLLCGDIQQERIAELLASGQDLSADLMKVPHHGLVETNTEDLVRAVSPAYAIICCSKKKPEDDETVDILEAAGAQVFITREGQITATSDKESITVEQ